MPRSTVTKRLVESAPVSGRDYFLWDDEVPGFGVKITAAGARVYVFQYRMSVPGKTRSMPTRRVTIGKHGELTPDLARRHAKQLAAQVVQGKDPRQMVLDRFEAAAAARSRAEQEKQAEKELAFEKLAEQWLAEYRLEHRPRSFEQAQSAIRKHVIPALQGQPLPAIRRAQLQRIIDDIPTQQPATRRTVYAYVSVFFGWAVKRGYIAESPTVAMLKPKVVKARERVLSDPELALVWRASLQLKQPLGAFYRLLILTGQRRDEVAGMQWDELDRASGTWTIPPRRTKNGVAQIVPLSAPSIAELAALAVGPPPSELQRLPSKWPTSGPVLSLTGKSPISCFSQAKKLLDDAIAELADQTNQLSPWRVHDLRRTLATGLQRLGVRFEVTEAVLNHVSGAKGGVAGIYQRHDWAEEKREALEAWSKKVIKLTSRDASRQK